MLVTVEVTVVVGGKVVEDVEVVEPDDHRVVPWDGDGMLPPMTISSAPRPASCAFPSIPHEVP